MSSLFMLLKRLTPFVFSHSRAVQCRLAKALQGVLRVKVLNSRGRDVVRKAVRPSFPYKTR